MYDVPAALPTSSTLDAAAAAPADRPTWLRRAAVAAAGVLASAVPLVFTINLTRMLLVGELADHRFHQLTGQGLVLCALWLGGLLPLLRAGWAGRRPSPAAGALHLVFAAAGAACAVVAPGGGAPVLVGLIVVTGALAWLALPLRPRLRTALQVHPLLAPLWLVAAAVTMPYVLEQLALQNAATGHHAANPHHFDMAWLAVTLVVLGLLSAVATRLRVLGLVAGAGLAWTGAVGVVLGVDRPWTLLALAVGVAATSLTVALGRPSDPVSGTVRVN